MRYAPLTLGTAGHIDHGKTTLIRALTGTDTDRLPQEQARGISIELGYARLPLPSGRSMSVIDVPGHERFVRTMVAGATGIDLYLFTIAADDGVMPQTREHAAVLRALAVDLGVVAVTKSDLADPEPAIAQARALLPHAAAVVAVSARTGMGLGRLLAAVDETAAQARSRAETGGPARLHIDRVFTVRGAGTVVTGTLWSGAIKRGDELVLLPQGHAARVRGLQVHDQPVQSAPAGQRVAVNLSGVARAEVARGDVLATAGTDLGPTFLADVALELEPPSGNTARELEHGDRVQIHHGTREVPARVAWLGGRFWQLRLEQPLIAAAGDRVVVRRIAPADTLGGGPILDPRARKHGPGRDLTDRLARLERGEPDKTAGDRAEPEPARSPDARPATRAQPSAPRLTADALALEQRLRAAGVEPPRDSELDPAALAALRAAGRAVRVSRTLHYHPEALADIRGRVIALAERRGGQVTLAEVRDELGTSRRFAQALLEHLDAERVTIRRGEAHVLRPGARRAAADGGPALQSDPPATGGAVASTPPEDPCSRTT
ncbi:MAG TPA: selenocysteine-specific translation elongation factor [Solirubrobacteraceae bacterium]|nr:selenocysteine-specific translation elongation factor [Solirubrobacteraceae bacterium]